MTFLLTELLHQNTMLISSKQRFDSDISFPTRFINKYCINKVNSAFKWLEE